MPIFDGLRGQWAPGLGQGGMRARLARDVYDRTHALAPFALAEMQAANRASSTAETIAQRGGNPFAAARLGAQAAGEAAAPIRAQAAAADSQMRADQQAQLRAEDEARRTQIERFLGAGLQAGASGLGMLVQGMGGQQRGPGAPALPGGVIMGGSPRAPAPAQSPMMPRSPGPLAQSPLQPGGAAAAPSLGGAQATSLAALAPPGAQGFDLASLLQQGGGIASLFPGYGQLVGMGLGGLGGMFR